MLRFNSARKAPEGNFRLTILTRFFTWAMTYSLITDRPNTLPSQDAQSIPKGLPSPEIQWNSPRNTTIERTYATIDLQNPP